MKKLITLFLIIMLMAMMLTGCGGSGTSETKNIEGEQSSENTDKTDADADTDKLGTLLSSVYVDMMKGDQYLMKYTASMDMEGQIVEMENTMAVSGENTMMISKGNGFDATTIIKDGYVYMVDHASKTVMKWEQSQEDMTGAMPAEEMDTIPAEEMKYMGTGKEDGLVYEEYATADGNVKYYFDGKDLTKIAVVSQGQTVVMENIEISNEVSDSMFEIPDGYQEVGM